MQEKKKRLRKFKKKRSWQVIQAMKWVKKKEKLARSLIRTWSWKEKIGLQISLEYEVDESQDEISKGRDYTKDH